MKTQWSGCGQTVQALRARVKASLGYPELEEGELSILVMHRGLSVPSGACPRADKPLHLLGLRKAEAPLAVTEPLRGLIWSCFKPLSPRGLRWTETTCWIMLPSGCVDVVSGLSQVLGDWAGHALQIWL